MPECSVLRESAYPLLDFAGSFEVLIISMNRSYMSSGSCLVVVYQPAVIAHPESKYAVPL